MISFFCPGEPAPQGSKKAFPVRMKSGQVRAVMTEANARTKPWRESIRWAALQARPENFALLDGPVHLAAEFYMPRPKAHFDSKGMLKASAPRYHATKPDQDKLLRALCDALTGIVWTDDSRVADSRVLKFYMNPTQMPGVDVQVRLLGER